MRASGALLARGSCTTGSRMRCLEPSSARRTLRGCHPFGVPVERGLLAARTSESVLCRQPLRPEQPKRRMAQCCRGEFVETRRWAPAFTRSLWRSSAAQTLQSGRGPHGGAGAGLPFHQQTPPQRTLGCLSLFGVPERSAVSFAQFAAGR